MRRRESDPVAQAARRTAELVNSRGVAELAVESASRKHVVVLLGSPLTGRSVLAHRLTNNRHLRVAHGGPVAIEFDECVSDRVREQVASGEALSGEEMDEMLDQVISRVLTVAEKRPVILSAFLPRVKERSRLLAALADRTVILLDAPSDWLVERADAAFAEHEEQQGVEQWLGLEAMVMIDEKQHNELRRSNEDSSTDRLEKLQHTVRWLNSVYEDLVVEHRVVDASQSLHEVAKGVRKLVIKALVYSSERSMRIERKPAAPIEKLEQVGGARGVFTTCCLGAVAGAVLGVAWHKLS